MKEIRKPGLTSVTHNETSDINYNSVCFAFQIWNLSKNYTVLTKHIKSAPPLELKDF